MPQMARVPQIFPQHANGLACEAYSSDRHGLGMVPSTRKHMLQNLVFLNEVATAAKAIRTEVLNMLTKTQEVTQYTVVKHNTHAV